MNEPVRTKSHEEWLELRRKGIGSSEVATILGLNPFDTPYLLWRRKRGELAEEPESEAMLMGHMLEDVVAKRWQRETGLEILPGSEEEILFVDEERPFMRVSPDRLYRKRPDGDEGILECKTTVKAVSPDEIPLHWFVQLQYQLGVAGMAKGSLAWLVQGRHFGQMEMDFVKDYFDTLAEAVERFWTENVLGGKEPEAVNVQDVERKHARHTDGKVLEATKDILSSYSRLKDIRAEMEKLEAEEQGETERLKMFMQDAEELDYEGTRLCTWKAGKDSQTFDSKRFKEENPDLYRKYLVAKPAARRFLIK